MTVELSVVCSGAIRGASSARTVNANAMAVMAVAKANLIVPHVCRMNESLKQSAFTGNRKKSRRNFFRECSNSGNCHVCRILNSARYSCEFAYCLRFGQQTRSGKVERGAETILGTEPTRNAAARLLTEADAFAFRTFRARDERPGNDEGGPERY